VLFDELPLPLGIADQSACRVDQISGAYGWWGERTRFLTSLLSCRTENYVPGLHLLTFQHPRNDSQPDKVQRPRLVGLSQYQHRDTTVTDFPWQKLFGPLKNLLYVYCVFIAWKRTGFRTFGLLHVLFPCHDMSPYLANPSAK
jgi:hypothetical protein